MTLGALQSPAHRDCTRLFSIIAHSPVAKHLKRLLLWVDRYGKFAPNTDISNLLSSFPTIEQLIYLNLKLTPASVLYLLPRAPRLQLLASEHYHEHSDGRIRFVPRYDDPYFKYDEDYGQLVSLVKPFSAKNPDFITKFRLPKIRESDDLVAPADPLVPNEGINEESDGDEEDDSSSEESNEEEEQSDEEGEESDAAGNDNLDD